MMVPPKALTHARGTAPMRVDSECHGGVAEPALHRCVRVDLTASATTLLETVPQLAALPLWPMWAIIFGDHQPLRRALVVAERNHDPPPYLSARSLRL
jgi:hypothetical protein